MGDEGQAFEAALERFTLASQRHEESRKLYRARAIGDEEYLRTHVEFKKACKALDDAEEALRRKYPGWGER